MTPTRSSYRRPVYRASMRMRSLSPRELATPPNLSQVRREARPLLRRIAGRRNRLVAVALWMRDDGKCQRCGLPIYLGVSAMAPGGLTIGHVVALARGGTNDMANLGPEHRRCNISAGARDPRPAAVIVTP